MSKKIRKKRKKKNLKMMAEKMLPQMKILIKNLMTVMTRMMMTIKIKRAQRNMSFLKKNLIV